MQTKKVEIHGSSFDLNYEIENNEVVTRSVMGEDGKDHLDDFEHTEDFISIIAEIAQEQNLPQQSAGTGEPMTETKGALTEEKQEEKQEEKTSTKGGKKK